jgi:hypothetical protein
MSIPIKKPAKLSAGGVFTSKKSLHGRRSPMVPMMMVMGGVHEKTV